MKFFLQSFDNNGNTCPTVLRNLIDHIPGRVDSMAQADVVFVVASYLPNYVFNPDLLKLDKAKIVLFDYLEHGWNAGEQENRLGKGVLGNFSHLASEEWAKFDQWVASIEPVAYFKRELFARDRTERILPCEYPCGLTIPPIQSEAEFSARPFQVLNCWGHSHPSRPRVHGEIFKAMGDKGIDVVSDWRQFEKLPDSTGRRWVSIYSPYWTREPIERVMEIQAKSQISVSLFGAGRKSFRDSEAPVGSIMARPQDSLAWSTPWVDMQNCIRLTEGNEVDRLLEIAGTDLYQIYFESQITVAKYCSEVYVKEWILPNIHL